jgi:superfamily II DNA/RNA helicase
MTILRQENGTVFVFVKMKEKAYQVWRLLDNKGFKDVTYIHSDLPQEAREAAVADFKSGKFRVIIATDVMGRGIDVDDVAHVVNYDVPREAADYIHRIGRTGRRGLTGNASTFAIPGKDDLAIKAIEKLRGVPAPPKSSPAPERRDSRPGRQDNHRSRNHQQHSPRPAPPVRSGPVVEKVSPPVPPATTRPTFLAGVKKFFSGIFQKKS